MNLSLGAVLEGKVTGIASYGAFISLPEGKSGMVHISEVSRSYVNDINDHLKEGQVVKVKVINIDENGRINLSIRKAEEDEKQAVDKRTAHQPNVFFGNGQKSLSFEDKLKQFMQDSESKMSDINKHNGNSRRGVRRGNRRDG